MFIRSVHILSLYITFRDGYCSTVQGLLDWFEVDLGFTELLFIHVDLYVTCIFVLYITHVLWFIVCLFVASTLFRTLSLARERVRKSVDATNKHTMNERESEGENEKECGRYE